MNGDYVLTASRVEQEKRGKIRTFTGRYVDPLNLRWRDVDVRDIAHHLACINRYTGAAPEPYSVAQHAVHVAWAAYEAGEPWIVVYAALNHDNGEYVFNDLASPVKRHEEMSFYKRREHDTTRMILAGLGVNPGYLDVVKKYDDQVFHAEVRSWWKGTKEIVPWHWQRAEQTFLEYSKTLRRLCGLDKL